MKKPSRQQKASRSRTKTKAAAKVTRGQPFERRAQRAIAQIHPDLVVTHNERLQSEYGVLRQFDVVGREGGAIRAIYEAREHGRKVDIDQQDGFSRKVEDLVEKPQRAGIISSSGFTSSPIKSVQHYGGTRLASELYTLTPSRAEDWGDDLREIVVHAEFQTMRVTVVRLIPPAGLTGGEVITASADRGRSFFRDAAGRIAGNLIDVVNQVLREAQRTNDSALRRLAFPDGPYLEIDGRRCRFEAIEIELEQVTLPAQTNVDFAQRFPDTLRDALTGKHWLIEDAERLPRVARANRELSLAFPDPEDSSYVGLDGLPMPERDPETGAPIERTIATLQLQLAVALATGGNDDVASPQLADLLTRANEAFAAGDFGTAEALYLESLNSGTALVALCNLAYLAEQRGDHDKAFEHSLLACHMFPTQPYGFVNAAAARLAAGRTADARQILDAGRPLHGASAVFRRQEADLFAREGHLADAARAYYELVLDDPTDGRIRACLAQCEAGLNQVEAAAWDARRALSDAPGDPVVAELASRYAARNGDSAAVLAVADHAASAGLDAPSVYRRAIDLATAAGEYVRALQWLDRIPRAKWSVDDYVVSGQLASVAGQRARAIDDLTHALASSEAAADVRPWLAENLVAVDRIDETIAVMVRLPPGVADQLAVDVLDRAYLARRMATCASLTKWLMARDSADASLLLRQAIVLGAQAIDNRDPSSLAQAEERFERAAAAGAREAEKVPAQLMLAVARGDEEAALDRADKLEADTVDVYAMFAGLADKRNQVALLARLLDRGLAATRVPHDVDPSALRAQRIACGFRLGEGVATLQDRIRASSLSNDMWGRTAAAALAYADGNPEACVRLLAQFMAAPKVPFSAVNLFGAALAELRRYDELCQHCASFGAAPLTDLALWAAERAPTRALRPNELVIASAAACMHESEFLGVAFGAQTMVCVPASDWASALRLCRANHPQPTEVWIVRRAYPREFLRSAFTPPPGIGA